MYQNRSAETQYLHDYKSALKQKIAYANTLTDEELKDCHYSNEQIAAIRHFDGSDEMLRAASSTLTIVAGFDPLTSSSSGSETKLVVGFSWNGIYTPGSIVSTNDIFGVSWSEPWKADDAGTIISLEYRNEAHNRNIWRDGEVIPNGIYSDGFLIPNNVLENVNGIPVGHWIQAGSISVPLSTKTQQVEISGFAAYGYNTISATPSISVSVSGGGVSIGGGFSFSMSVEVLEPTRFYG